MGYELLFIKRFHKSSEKARPIVGEDICNGHHKRLAQWFSTDHLQITKRNDTFLLCRRKILKGAKNRLELLVLRTWPLWTDSMEQATVWCQQQLWADDVAPPGLCPPALSLSQLSPGSCWQLPVCENGKQSSIRSGFSLATALVEHRWGPWSSKCLQGSHWGDELLDAGQTSGVLTRKYAGSARYSSSNLGHNIDSARWIQVEIIQPHSFGIAAPSMVSLLNVPFVMLPWTMKMAILSQTGPRDKGPEFSNKKEKKDGDE